MEIQKLSKEELVRIRKIQLKMDSLATNLLAGAYRSTFKGRGMEFEEVREFQTGDEVRSVDWNVTARMGYPYVKLFREERDLTVYFLIDMSTSLQFSSQATSKQNMINEIAAVLAFSGIKNQDKIGLILFTDKIEHYLPPSKGVRHVLRLIRDIYAFTPTDRKTDLAEAIKFLLRIQKKRCVIFILSDFIDNKPYEKEIAILSHLHQVVAIGIQDPKERLLPEIGLVQFQDLETNETTLINLTHSTVQKSATRSHDFFLKAKQTVEKNKGSWIEVSTDRSYTKDLLKFFLKK